MEGGDLRIRHGELRKLVAEAPVATKLSAVLDASAMARDAYVSWEQYWPSGGKVYSPGAALTVSANVAALLFLALGLVWLVVSETKHGFQHQKWGRWLAPVAVAVGMIVYFAGLPKIGGLAFKTARVHSIRVRSDSMQLAMALGEEMGDTNLVKGLLTPARPLTAAELERLLQATIRDFQPAWSRYSGASSPLTNFFTGEAIRFEASPGNVLLRPAAQPSGDYKLHSVPGADAYELVWHDLDGAAAMTNLVPTWNR